MVFKIDIDHSSPELKKDVEDFESSMNYTLPSDYKYLLLNFNGLRLVNDHMAMILDQNGEEISGLDGAIYSLKEFRYSSNPYPSVEHLGIGLSEKMEEEFFSIATLFYQGILLIGRLPYNENKIFGFVPDYQDSIFFISDNIIEFFNEKISIIK